jgi:hypothetical protein
MKMKSIVGARQGWPAQGRPPLQITLGKLDKAWDAAATKGWTVDTKLDWNKFFPG